MTIVLNVKPKAKLVALLCLANGRLKTSTLRRSSLNHQLDDTLFRVLLQRLLFAITYILGYSFPKEFYDAGAATYV